jgi:hypothetical protein
MKVLNYCELPPKQRTQWENFAEELVREVPDTAKPIRFMEPGIALRVPYMRANKLVAALVYRDKDGWAGDLVFRHGATLRQIGYSEERYGLASTDLAVNYLGSLLHFTRALSKPQCDTLPDEYRGQQEVEFPPYDGLQFVFSRRSLVSLARKFARTVPFRYGDHLVNHFDYARRMVTFDECPANEARQAAAFLAANGELKLPTELPSFWFIWCQLNKASGPA